LNYNGGYRSDAWSCPLNKPVTTANKRLIDFVAAVNSTRGYATLIFNNLPNSKLAIEIMPGDGRLF
jgi:hypothetical protein